MRVAGKFDQRRDLRAKAPTLIERHPEFFDFAQDRL